MTFTVRAILHWGAPSGISESRMLVSSTTETNMQWLILSDFSLKKLTTARPHALNQLNSNRKRLNLIFTVPGLFMSESGVISFRKLSAGCSQVFMSTCLACFLNVLALIELSLAFSVCCLRFTTACNSASSSLFDELSDSDSLMGLSGSLLDAELSSPAALAGTLSLASGTSCPCHKRLNDMAIKHKICFGSVSLCNGEAHFLRPLIFNGRFKLNVESTPKMFLFSQWKPVYPNQILHVWIFPCWFPVSVRSSCKQGKSRKHFRNTVPYPQKKGCGFVSGHRTGNSESHMTTNHPIWPWKETINSSAALR